MALIADTNFTNNLTTVAAFSPFPTGGGNKVLKINDSGVLIDNDVDVANISQGDLLVNALIDGTAGIVGDFGFIVNRNVGGAFYYLNAYPQGSLAGEIHFRIHQYSGGAGGTFTLLRNAQVAVGLYVVNTIHQFRAIYKMTNNGPHLSILFDGQTVLSYTDIAVSQITSGQPGFAGALINNGPGRVRYVDNWFARETD